MINSIDLVTDLVYGDCCKKQVSYSLSQRNKYTHTMRANGSQNSGGTVVYKDKAGNICKIILQMLPSGVLTNKKSIIGHGCVVNIHKLFNEIEKIKSLGFNVDNNIFIYKNAHCVTQSHIEEEEKESKIGTTKQGVGPAYRDKYARSGLRMIDVYNDYKAYFDTYGISLIDPYEYLYESKEKMNILVEMAQGFYLDIDSNNYPYVTSSHTTTAGALLNYLPHNKIEKIYGCCKVYDTYVGSNKFQPDDPIFNEIGDLGKEYGSVTGRRRQCNWLNIDALKKAVDINCVTNLVVSKLDVFQELNKNHNNEYWNILSEKQNKIFSMKTEAKFKSEISLVSPVSEFRNHVMAGINS